MKATTLLRGQHKQVRDLFKKIENTESPDMRRRLLGRVEGELSAHTKIEEEIFYPAVRSLETRKAEELVNEAYEEHHVVDLVLNELPQVDPGDERFEAKMTVLSELVDHHAKEEEKRCSRSPRRSGVPSSTTWAAAWKRGIASSRARAGRGWALSGP